MIDRTSGSRGPRRPGEYEACRKIVQQRDGLGEHISPLARMHCSNEENDRIVPTFRSAVGGMESAVIDAG